MSEPPEPPSAQVVAHEFVKQYYTMLNAAPGFLHRFYSHNSTFIHGDDQVAVTGQGEIHKKMMSLNFINCHARICQVDSQSSVAGSVVVQVIGELSNAGQPMRCFVQSFVLAPQAANKYYVHVDIFRYQDDGVSINESDKVATSSEKKLENGGTTKLGSDEDTAVSTIVDITVDGNAFYTNENESALAEDINVPLSAAPNDTEVTEEKTQSAVNEGDADKIDDTVVNQADNTTELKAAEPEITHNVAPAKPLTWAALAGRNAGGVSAQPVNSATGTSRSTTVVVDQKPEQTSVPPRVVKPAPQEERTNGSSSRSPGNASNDNQQIFVGNLPQHLADQELITFFEQFGPVVDFRINRRAGGSQAGNNLGQKNFGFMSFDSTETVKKVLAARPLFMGKLRLNIEEKKPKEELASTRPRPARVTTGTITSKQGSESANNFTRSVPNGSGSRRNLRNDVQSNSRDEGRSN